MLFEAEAKDILIGACDVFMYPFTGSEIPEDAVIETAEHSVGHCSSCLLYTSDAADEL